MSGGVALLLTILGALLVLAALAGKAGQSLFYLACYILLRNLLRLLVALLLVLLLVA